MVKKLEELEQTALVQWFDYTYPQYTKITEGRKRISLLWHIPNGGLRIKSVAYRLKKQGVRPGVPDLFLAVAKHGFFGLFIEMKSKDGKVTKEQEIYLDILNEQGYKAVVCYGWNEAAKIIKEYLNECAV